MTSLRQPYDPSEFNFNLIKLERELIFELVRQDDNNDNNNIGYPRSLVVINASPVEFGSCLLLPFVELGLPQVRLVIAEG